MFENSTKKPEIEGKNWTLGKKGDFKGYQEGHASNLGSKIYQDSTFWNVELLAFVIFLISM